MIQLKSKTLKTRMTENAIDKIDDRILSILNQNDLTISILIFFTVLIYQTALGILRGTKSLTIKVCVCEESDYITAGSED